MIAFLDLAAANAELRVEIDAAVQRVIESGWYIGGTEVIAFEERYADYCGADHCVGVGNGLDALHLALRAMDVGPGDEVIVASNGFIATWLAVSMTGGRRPYEALAAPRGEKGRRLRSDEDESPRNCGDNAVRGVSQRDVCERGCGNRGNLARRAESERQGGQDELGGDLSAGIRLIRLARFHLPAEGLV